MPPIAPVPYQKLVRVFESDGFTFVRQRGDHLIYTKPGLKRPIVIPTYPAVPVCRTALRVVAQRRAEGG